MPRKTPKGFRLHIALFGRRNVGKSSLLNAMTRQDVAIVSAIAGTTTDPVEKPMELLPLGPVLFIDTAGIDDAGVLGDLRTDKTRLIFDRTDMGIIVCAEGEWTEFEEMILHELRAREIPALAVFNKSDLNVPDAALIQRLDAENIPWVQTAAVHGDGMLDVREALIQLAPDDYINSPVILRDLVPPGEVALLVVPIDLEAPKGRLILPQVQAIRDLLDNDSDCMIIKEHGLLGALDLLKRPPALVVTDSQVFERVNAETPREIPMTSFSILYARAKGNVRGFVQGTRAIDNLVPGDRVLVAEACTHHPIGEDIGRVKIPRWLRRHVGGELEIEHVQGHDFPADLSPYKLVIQCGGCMWNRREMLSRQIRCRKAGVPMSNYGMTIAFLLGVLERTIEPFALDSRVTGR